jgi:hypothetical protein
MEGTTYEIMVEPVGPPTRPFNLRSEVPLPADKRAKAEARFGCKCPESVPSKDGNGFTTFCNYPNAKIAL